MAARKLSLAAFRQMWPPFVTPAVRTWIIERTSGGSIEQGEIATNAPISTLRSGGPPVPDDGLSDCDPNHRRTLRPFDNLPEIRDADLVTRVKGRTTTVTLGRGVVQMPSGRKLTVANGVFEVRTPALKIRPPRFAPGSRARWRRQPSFSAWTASRTPLASHRSATSRAMCWRPSISHSRSPARSNPQR